MSEPTRQAPSDLPVTHTDTGEIADLAPTNANPHGSVKGLKPSTLQALPWLGGVTVLRSHAQGGLGEVLLARDEQLHREVAFKRIRVERANDAEARRRFELEAEITAKLEHPGIVPIYGMVHGEDGQPCYVMRFIHGESLKDAIQNYHRSRLPFGALPFRALLQKFITVCETVAFAHSKGIIHRDLKPANVMLGKYGETLVVDWGLAKPFGRTEVEKSTGEASLTVPPTEPGEGTQMGHTIGTAAYMPPEQATGRWNIVGPASDVYCLGAILYEMLTCQRPVQGQDSYEVLAKVQRGDFPWPRHWRSDVPKPLEAACLKAMALKPEDRYQTCKELAADVEHWLADEPVSAYGEPWPNRTRRWLRRHRSLVASVVAALVVALAALTAVTLLTTRHATELTAKNAELIQAKQVADERFEIAKEAVDKYLTSITYDEDLNKADFHKLRKKLLATAVPFYQKLAAAKKGAAQQEMERGLAHARLAFVHNEMGERGEAQSDFNRMRTVFSNLATHFPSVPEYRHQLAISHIGLGNLLRELGQFLEADEALRAALAIRSQLASDFANVPKYRQELARCHASLASLRRDLHEWAKAAVSMHNAVEIAAQLAAESPKDSGYRADLASYYGILGVIAKDQGSWSEAEQALRSALEIAEGLVADFPNVSDYRSQLARAHNDLGTVLMHVGRRSDAEQQFRRALDIQIPLAVEFPSVPLRRLELSGTYVNLGNLFVDDQQAADSLDWYTKAVDLLAPLVASDPRLVAERLFLRNAHRGRAVALDLLARPAEAVKDWDEAIDLDTGPARLGLRMSRALSLARGGAHAKAIAEANALAQSRDADGATLYHLACICACSSAAAKDDAKLKDQYAARAVELLRQAVARGYKDIEHLKKDDGLRALREREDFKKLLESPERKDKPNP
jgi:eukaryotic-like serine/threonine-protein kinase